MMQTFDFFRTQRCRNIHHCTRQGRLDAARRTSSSQQDGVIRQQVIEHLMQQIMQYDGEFRREEATSAVGSYAKH